MTSFDALEQSREGSRPIETYVIVLGSDTFRWTSAEDDLMINGDLYTAIPISRNTVIIGADQQRRTLSVTVSATNEFASQFANNLPGQAATLSLFRYQRDEVPAFDTHIILFTGKVQSVQFTNDGQNASINVRSIEAALSRNLPRVTYMGMCGAFLYDRFCGADPNLHNFIGTVTSVAGNTITVAGAGASGHLFTSGYCRPVAVEDYRMVVSQSGDELTLLLPFQFDPTGSSLQCFAGCDHLVDGDCATVFDRVADFLGFPFVPNKNIFQTGIQ